ncbi:MAG: hypothetical protein KBA86_03135 [Bacteroidales bacterium]|jgi:hypothetical protein|nr:hypothetical protein [Bacteroidales bacterium]
MKQNIFKNKKYSLPIWMCIPILLFFLILSSCKSGQQLAVEEQEAKKESIEQEAEKNYKEAVKQHKKNQSKATRKMMKKSEKQRKKRVNKTIRKNRTKPSCVS